MRQRHWSLNDLVLPLTSALQRQGDVWLIIRKMMGQERCSTSLRPFWLWSVVFWQTTTALVCWNTAFHTVGATGALTSDPGLLYATQGADTPGRLPLSQRIHPMFSALKMWNIYCYAGLWLLNSPPGSFTDLHLSLLLLPHQQIGVLQFSVVD